MKFMRSACIEPMYSEIPFLDRFQAAKDDGFEAVEFWDWRIRDLDATRAAAEKDPAFAAAEKAIKKDEIELAKAEVFSPADLPAIRERIQAARRSRAEALKKLGIQEADLMPRYACPKCSDTGFLPDGRMCDCYQE